LAAISEPHGINQNVLVTLHNMVGLQLLHLYIVTQKSKMAAAIGGYFLKNFKKKQYLSLLYNIAAKFQRQNS